VYVCVKHFRHIFFLQVCKDQVGVLARVCGCDQDPRPPLLRSWQALTPGKRLCCALVALMTPVAECWVLFARKEVPSATGIFAALPGSLFFFQYFLAFFDCYSARARYSTLLASGKYYAKLRNSWDPQKLLHSVGFWGFAAMFLPQIRPHQLWARWGGEWQKFF